MFFRIRTFNAVRNWLHAFHEPASYFPIDSFFFFVTGVLIKSHATGTGSTHAQVIRECRTNLVIARGTEGLLEAGGLVAAAVRWTTPTRLPRP